MVVDQVDAHRGGRWNRRVAVSTVVGYVIAAVSQLVFSLRIAADSQSPFEGMFVIGGFGVVALLGALLVARRPRHPMGWIFATVGLLVAVGVSGNTVAAWWYVVEGRPPNTAITLLAWPNNWYWFLLLGLLFVFIPLLFPDGRLPSRRWWWRVPAWIVAASTVALCVLGAVAERVTLQDVEVTLPNPIGISGMPGVEQHPLFGLLSAALMLGIVTAVTAVVVRFRRSRGDERQQLKWFLSAVSLLPAVVLTELVALPDLVGDALFGAAVVLLPLAIALAILRYRLYDLDRIVSRTVTYVVVSGLLVAVYLAAVVLLRGVLAPIAGDSGVAVAGSTLLVAGLFGPVRRRVQVVVDRRFNRSRVDAERILAAFSSRLRDQIDLDEVASELRTAVQRTVQPTDAHLWLLREVVR